MDAAPLHGTAAEFFVADTEAMRMLLEAVLSLRRSGAAIS
jgi:hypothetical protein